MRTEFRNENTMIPFPRKKDYVHFGNTCRIMDTRPLEILYSILTIAWTLTLFFSAREKFQIDNAFIVMRAVGPYWVWGVWASGIWLLRMYGLIMNNLACRTVAAYCGFLIWFLTTVSLYIGGAVMLPAIFLVLSVFNGWISAKLSKLRAQIGKL